MNRIGVKLVERKGLPGTEFWWLLHLKHAAMMPDSCRQRGYRRGTPINLPQWNAAVPSGVRVLCRIVRGRCEDRPGNSSSVHGEAAGASPDVIQQVEGHCRIKGVRSSFSTIMFPRPKRGDPRKSRWRTNVVVLSRRVVLAVEDDGVGARG
ncbi:hypothetical protein BGZ61DRAFT_440426, partial [Ilyonectria robusta]|uniref:uncharacterized protein n=1 Tax=Ilyonectria robusta TaxID=1079257 RepID=UPI001E8E6F33